MAGKGSNPLMTIGMIAAAAVATYFTAGAAAPAMAAAAEGAAVGGAAAAGGTAAAGGIAAGEGLMAGEAAMMAGEGLAMSEGLAAGGLAAGEGLSFTTAVEGGTAALGEAATVSPGFTGAMDSALMTNASDVAAMEFIPSQEATMFAATEPAAAAPVAEAGAAPMASTPANPPPGAGWSAPPAELPAPTGMPSQAPADLTGAFDKPFSFGSIIGKNGVLSYGEAGSLTLAGAGGMMKSGQSQADASSQQQLLDAQMAQSRLAESSRELQSQQRLSQTLAAQTVGFFARGQQTGSGSARALSEAAVNEADIEANLTDAAGAANDWAYAAKSSQLSRRKSTAWMSPLFDMADVAATGYRHRSLIGSV